MAAPFGLLSCLLSEWPLRQTDTSAQRLCFAGIVFTPSPFSYSDRNATLESCTILSSQQGKHKARAGIILNARCRPRGKSWVSKGRLGHKAAPERESRVSVFTSTGLHKCECVLYFLKIPCKETDCVNPAKAEKFPEKCCVRVGIVAQRRPGCPHPVPSACLSPGYSGPI